MYTIRTAYAKINMHTPAERAKEKDARAKIVREEAQYINRANALLLKPKSAKKKQKKKKKKRKKKHRKYKNWKFGIWK